MSASAAPRSTTDLRRRLTALGLALALAWVGGCAGSAGPGPAPSGVPSAAPVPSDGGCREAPDGSFEVESGTPARPPFFRVTGPHGATLYLLGTVHVGPPTGWILPDDVRSALEASDSVVMEIDLARAGEELVSDLLLRLALIDDGGRLADRIDPETQRLLDAASARLSALGFPPATQQVMEPWFIALLLLESQVQYTPYDALNGADAQVDAARGDRPVIALETAEQQLRFFDDLPPDLQEAMLRDALEDPKRAAQEIIDLAWSWHRGDAENLACLARAHVDDVPELEAFLGVLLDDRNRVWSRALAPYLDRADAGAPLFGAVGALHLVGPGSLTAMLREAGYRVERLSHPPQSSAAPKPSGRHAGAQETP